MRVSIDMSVLDDPTSFDLLDDIARLLQTGQHQWAIDETDVEAIESCAWLMTEPESRAGRRHRELFEKTAKQAIEHGGAALQELRSTDPSPRAHSISVVIGSSDGVEPKEARSLLQRPAYLLVEDDESDRRFLLCLIIAFEREELLTALDNGWLEVVHCGGKGGMHKRAERLLDVPGVMPARLRVLLDSDRLFPGHDSDAMEIARRLEGLGLSVHVLHKRESENYLPFAVLELVRQAKAYRTFRDRLTPEQQDHFDMKKGFGRSRSSASRGRARQGEPVVPELQSALFGSVPKGVLSNLVGGFGGGCGKLFGRPEITREGLEARCRHGNDDDKTELLGLLLDLEMML